MLSLVFRDALREAEEAVRVDGPFDPPEPRQVRPVVRVRPGRQLRIDVVLVREAGDMRTQLGIDLSQPREPAVLGCVLDGKERVTVHEGGRVLGHSVDRAAMGVEEDGAAARALA